MRTLHAHCGEAQKIADTDKDEVIHLFEAQRENQRSLSNLQQELNSVDRSIAELKAKMGPDLDEAVKEMRVKLGFEGNPSEFESAYAPDDLSLDAAIKTCRANLGLTE